MSTPGRLSPPDYVLGVHFGHEAGVAVVNREGRPVFALSEERLSRVKMQDGTPLLALEAAITTFGRDAVAAMPIAIGGLPPVRDHWRRLKRYLHCDRRQLAHSSHWAKALLRCAVLACSPRAWQAPEMDCWRRFSRGPYVPIDHHEAHAASAYYCMGERRALLVTLDGEGNQRGATLYAGEEGRLRLLDWRYFTPFPVGKDYEIMTAVLGFNPARHCGKVTGLAALGRPEKACREAMETFLSKIWTRGGYPFHRLSEEDMARYRKLGEQQLAAYSREELAHAIQALTEERAKAWVRQGQSLFNAEHVGLAGGTFANVRVNQKIRELGFTRLFVQPAMSDAGIALGAAQALLARLLPLEPHALEHVYLGPAPSETEMEEALKQQGVPYERPDELADCVAQLLANKHIVARCDGPMEFGPRALGNRSILYHASDPSVNDWLNKRLQRSEFMPFAPITLAERADDYYKDLDGIRHTARFMTITCDCTPRMKEHCSAAVHVDGTARPQLVQRDTAPEIHAILQRYEARTGVATVINTSFNMHEEPIVCTAREAVRAFLQADLDNLVLGPFLASKPSSA